MQTKTRLSLLLLLAIAIGPSCKKDEDKKASKTDLLTTGQWRMTAFTVDPATDIDFDGVPDSDVYAAMPPCERDNYVVFHKGGTGELNEGPTKCDASDPQTEAMSWSLENNETELVVDGDRSTIAELTASRLVVRQAMYGSTLTVTFGK